MSKWYYVHGLGSSSSGTGTLGDPDTLIRVLAAAPADTGQWEDGCSPEAPVSTFTPRGKACPDLRAGVQARGKGEMEMYFVSALA